MNCIQSKSIARNPRRVFTLTGIRPAAPSLVASIISLACGGLSIRPEQTPLCTGPCAGHPIFKDFPQLWRGDINLVTRLCASSEDFHMNTKNQDGIEEKLEVRLKLRIVYLFAHFCTP